MTYLCIVAIFIPLTLLALELLYTIGKQTSKKKIATHLSAFSVGKFRYPMLFIEQTFIISSVWFLLGIILMSNSLLLSNSSLIHFIGLIGIALLLILALLRRYF